MASPFFDDNDNSLEANAFPPLWSLDWDDKDELLRWAMNVYEELTRRDAFKHAVQKELIARYRGYHLKYEPVLGYSSLFGARVDRTKSFPRIITNHYRSLIEQKVAMQIRYRPDTEPLPDSQEYRDKASAIVAKKFLKHIKLGNRIDLFYPQWVRRSILTGQAWAFPRWDKTIGESTGKIETKRIKRPDLSSFTIEELIREGDVILDRPFTHDVFIFPARTAAETPALMRRSYVPVYDLRLQYPKLQDDILPGKNLSRFDYALCEDVFLTDHALVLEFFYRAAPACPRGIYLKVCSKTILEEPQPLPIPPEGKFCYEFGNIPAVRLVDDEIDEELDGRPSALDLIDAQTIYDKLTTHFAMNVAYYCHPKWMFQKGACDPKSFANIPGLYIEYTSAIPPKLEIASPITQDQFMYRNSILEGMEKTFGVYSVSRGSPPPGTRAASQLYFYDEQEAQLNAAFKRKFDAAVEALDALLLSLAAQYYSGKKTILILGEDNRWLAETLDTKDLQKPYTIRVKSSSNLPDSKYARLNALFELYQLNPNQATWNQLMEMIDFGQQEKLIDAARMSVLCAEHENELLMRGDPCPPPEKFELHLDHRNVHIRLCQAPGFKTQDAKIKMAVEEHIGAHELFLIEMGEQNPLFKQKLMMLDQFPMYATFPPANPVQQQTPTVPIVPQETGAATKQEGPTAAELLAAEGGQVENINEAMPVEE